MPGDLIATLGTEAQKQQWLPSMASGDAMTGFCLSEPDAGSDAESIRTLARRVDGGFVIDGLKHFVSNAPRSQIFVVMARVENEGVGIFVLKSGYARPHGRPASVDDGTARASRTKWCFRTATYRRTRSSATRRTIPIGDGCPSLARLARGAIAIGTGKRALELATEYAARSSAVWTANRHLPRHPVAACRFRNRVARGPRACCYASPLASMLGTAKRREPSWFKLFASEVTARVVDRALQVLGGAGYTKELPYERFYRDVRQIASLKVRLRYRDDHREEPAS